MEKTVKYWIETLKLVRQTNGTYLKEFYRSDEILRKDQLPFRYRHQRNFATSHYFLIEGTVQLKLQRKKSDEIWHFCYGSPFTFHIIDEEGIHSKKVLGNNPDSNENFQVLIKRGSWYAITLNDTQGYALAAISSTPGSSPDDHDKGLKSELNRQFPHLKQLIDEYGE